MKKILSLILCLVLACGMLVGCDENEFPDPNYEEQGSKLELLTLNLYIVCGDNMAENAKVSVQNRIAGYMKTSEYKTILNVHYINAANYEAEVKNAIAAGGDKMPHVVLINSESMFNSLYNAEGGNKLLDLTDYVNSTDFKTLKTQIAASLMASSRVDEKLYSIPNNHVVGEYSYLVVNEEVEKTFHEPYLSSIKNFKSLEDAAEVMARIENAGYNASDYIYTVNGPYELKAELEAQGNYCNVIKYPTVTASEAFSSAFAVIKNPLAQYNDRAMRIIYAINNDTELRNLLQYGVFGANYDLVDNQVVRKKDNLNFYDMDLLYTGDIFKANYCEELGWNASARAYGSKQNEESVSAK